MHLFNSLFVYFQNLSFKEQRELTATWAEQNLNKQVAAAAAAREEQQQTQPKSKQFIKYSKELDWVG